MRPWRLQCASSLALSVVDGHSESTSSHVCLLYNCVGCCLVEHYSVLGIHIQLYFSHIILMVKFISLKGLTYIS